MKKILNYLSIVLFTMTLFSCSDKNTWNSSAEVEFKKNAKEDMLKTGNEAIHHGENIKNLPEDHNIFADLENEWNPETEKKYKAIVKNNLLHKGFKEEKATFMAECAISKMKEQNLKPNDVRNPQNAQKLLTISVNCTREIEKK